MTSVAREASKGKVKLVKFFLLLDFLLLHLVAHKGVQ